MENIIDILKGNAPALTEEEKKALAEQYEEALKYIVEKYPEPVLTEEEIEMQKRKKEYKFHDGDIYALKDGAYIWVIPLQYTLSYHKEDRLEPMYVQVNSWAWDNSCVFCHRVEKNLFGMVKEEQCELEVAFESLDLSKVYTEKEMVKPFPWIDYVYNNDNKDNEDEKVDNEHSENEVE